MGQRRHLIPHLENLDSAIVACAGDIMLDRFVYGDVSRISPEAPIPVLHVKNQRSTLGGLGNAVRNLGSLGCGVRLFSICGEDAAGAEIETLLQQVPRCQASLERETARATPVKTRFIAHGQQLLRADQETAEAASDAAIDALLEQFRAQVDACSIVFLSDYSKGVLHGRHAQAFIQIARAAGKPIVVDPKGTAFERYRFATVIKPNLKELAEATHMPVANTSEQTAAARKILEQTEAQFILLTRGAAGMLLVPREGAPSEFQSLAREVYDVSGAGDTVAAVLSAALGSGAGISAAAELANIAAGIVVGKVGTATVDRSEIIQEIERDSAHSAASKIMRASDAIERRTGWGRKGARVGFAYGSFHPLTSRHLEVLENVRSQCDWLVVGLAAGDVEAQSRALLLASLMHVDAVVVCKGDFPREFIDQLKPDVVAEEKLGAGR